MRFLAVWVALLCVQGCAPSLQTMVQRRHYGDALCGAREQNNQATREAIADAIVRDIAPAVFVQEITEQDWQRLPGVNPSALRENYLVLRTLTEYTRSPLSRVSVSVDLADGQRSLGAVPPTMRTIALVTHETIPPDVFVPAVTYGPNPIDSAIHTAGSVLGAVGSAIVAVGTLGIIQPNWGSGPAPQARTIPAHYDPPTEAQLEASAPVALRLHGALSLSCDSREDRCEQYVLYRRQDVERASLRLVVSVQLEGAYRCPMQREYTVTVPPGPDTSTRFAGMFRGGLRTLPELGVR